MLVGQNSSPGGMSYTARRKGDRLRVQGVGTLLPDDTECAWLSRSTPSGFPHGEAPDTREHHTWTIAYPIQICCPDH